MTYFITGSRGKTALPLTELLAPKYPVVVASRSPKPDAPHPTIRFDWHDRSTWEAPFSHGQAQSSPITAVYLVGPDEVTTGSDHVIAFMRHAQLKGVKRIVLLSAWEINPGGVLMGRAHEALKAMGDNEGMEWAVLRPNFFMENFAEGYHKASIKDGIIYSGADDGRLAFVSANDIAAVAFRALTDQKPHNTDHIITGSAALSYDDVATAMTGTLGRTIKHVRLDPKGFEEILRKGHLTPEMADYMTNLDRKVANGDGSAVTNTVETVTGKAPRLFQDFVLARKDVWA